VSVAPPFSRHLADLCEEQALRDPEGLAVISRGQEITYSQLHAEVRRLAVALSARGVGRGSIVALLCPNRLEWLLVALAVVRLGGRVAAFNTFVRAWDLEYMLEHSGAEVLVTLDRFRSSNYLKTLRELDEGLLRDGRSERFPNLRELIVIDSVPSAPPAAPTLLSHLLEQSGTQDSDSLASEVDREHAAARSALDIAFVLYTSGSSARPKAVPLRHCALLENGFEIGERMELTRTDRVWVSVPLYWAYGACNALPATLTHGATLVLQEAFAAGEALELIERHRCTAAYVLPNIARSMIAHESFARQRTASLRTGLTLGSPAEVELIAKELAIPRICNIYGQTESYGNCCVTPASWPLERRAICQGPPLPRVSIAIRAADGADVPAGEIGEIHVRGYVAPGYVDAPESAQKAFGADGWFATADLGLLDEEGCLQFSARAAEMIKTGGINVSPGEVEEFLATHDAIDEVAVVGAPDERMGQVVVAFVVTRGQLAEDELRSWCAERLAAYKVPVRVHVLERLAMTDNGKLDRRRLAQLDSEKTAVP
jgi:fatty-acyl-CoA synthase